MGIKSNGESPEDSHQIGNKLTKLLSTYGDPQDSTNHARLADEIKRAVIDRNKDDLLKKINYFGNARNNESGTQRMQMIEMFCASEARAIIDELKTFDEFPWDELTSALGLSNNRIQVPVAEGPSEKELENAEVFIQQFVLHNDGLSPEAKEFLVNTARSDRGPWCVEGHVTGVVQNDKQITIIIKNGKSYYYLG